MTIKASGRPALILAAGLFVCFAGPSQAATGAAATASSKSEAAGAPGKHAKHSFHHPRKYAQRKSGKVALRARADKPAADNGDNSLASSAIPPSVANANAQLASADTPAGSARAMSARANEILQVAPLTAQPAADAEVVSPDQLNDPDRAPPDSASPAPAVKMAAAEAPVPAAPAPPAVAASSNESSDETSLIGKIFIGFGALLTMASAARMFMA
jgi:hypothetical protein